MRNDTLQVIAQILILPASNLVSKEWVEQLTSLHQKLWIDGDIL